MEIKSFTVGFFSCFLMVMCYNVAELIIKYVKSKKGKK